MLQDYETCTSTLRLLSPELKSDKAWKHYAGVQAWPSLLDLHLLLPEPLSGHCPLHNLHH